MFLLSFLFILQGVPRLVDVSQSCEYVFEWETNVVCSDDVVEKETSNCTYYDQRADNLIDLSPLNDLNEVWFAGVLLIFSFSFLFSVS